MLREIASGNTEPTGITFNAFDGYFYVTNDTRDRLVTRYDNNLDNPLYEFAPQDDVPGASDPEGITSDPATGRLFVADGHDGGVQILTYSLDMSDPNSATRAVRYEGSFSVADLLDDVEGIAFHPPSGNLFLMDGSQDTVFEYTTAGVLIEQYDINSLSPRPKTPQGLTFAPTSSTTDHPDALALYIADGGSDNFPDGGVYEAIIGEPMNFPPITSGISDKRIVVGDREVVVDLFGAFLDYEDPDAALSYAVESVSNPFLVSSTTIDASSGTLTVTAVPGAIGTAEIAVRATDTGDPALSVATTFTLRVDPIDPANQTTIQSRVSAPSDDAEEQLSGRVLVGSSDLELSLDGVTSQVVGIRFTDLKIPAGAYIQDAYIQFQADEKDSEATSLTIRAQAIDDAPTFRSTIRNISSRDTTSASADWSPEAWTTTGQAGVDQRTSDLSAVVQEIVDRPGWWSGNAMAFIVTGSGRRVAESFNGKSEAAPLLVVEYSTRVSIGGTPSEGHVLTASNSISSDARVGDVTYQWLRDGVDIPGATGPAFALSQVDIGASIAVAAIYRDGQGTLRNVVSADVGPIANVNDDPVGSVTISGIAIQGEALNAANTLTDADGLGTISYQWRRDGVEIPGATSSTYTLLQADVGRTITATASYTDGAGTLEAITSDATAVVANVNDAPVGDVEIVNQAPAEDDVLTIANRLTDEDGLGVFSYQWQRDLVDIPGAINSSYSLSQADVGSIFTVTVSYTDGFGVVESVTSTATVVVHNLNDLPIGEVTINNLAPVEDDLLHASNTLADDDGLGTVGYQWKRNDIPIPTATDSSYLLVQADVGSVITVTASYTDGHGTIESVTSVATAPVVNRNDAPSGGVAIDNLTPTEDDTLTAISTIDDEDGLGVITYQWMRDGIDIPGATTSSYTLLQADVGSVIRVTAVYADGQGTLESVTSAGTVAVLNKNDLPTGSVNIDKLSPAEDDVLTASNALQDKDGLGQVRYQWARDGIDILGATGNTYTLTQADVGALITVTASYVDALGTDEAVTSLATAPVSNLNDLPTGIVSIDNVAPTEDDLLTVSHTLDDEDGLGTIGFQWKRDGVNIPDANASSYTVTQADVGSVISVAATYSDRQGTFEAVDSVDTAVVQNLNDSPTGGVTIDNLTPAEDDTLTVSNTLADEDGLGEIRYQWKRDNVDIPGATFSSYRVVQSDVDAVISVTAIYTDGQGAVESVSSPATAAVTNINDMPTGAVTIDNLTPAEDDELTVANTLADEDGLGTIVYQWHRDGVDVPGATAIGYILQQIDVGAVISVTASYTDGYGAEERVTASATAPTTNVNDDPVGSVFIDGIPSARQVLTAANTLTDEDGLGTISYQWQRSGVDIEGATGTTYTLAADDIGFTMTVVASYIDGQGTFQQVSSASIGPITPNRVPTGHVIITGTPREDQTLTATNTLADEDGLGLISYQWQRDGVDIPGGALDTYTLTQADVGTAVSVVARYTDGLGTVEAVTSVATELVENVNDAPSGGVVIDEMAPAEDDLLTADITLADEDGLGPISYQWQRDGVAIPEATGQSYRLTQADVGKTITVTASYSDGQGTPESATSPATAQVQNRNDAPTGSVTINNVAPAEDDVLSVANNLADEDGLGTVEYQWHRDGVAIPGATASSFRLRQIDVGAVISVTASYIDGHGTEETLSATTSPVVNVNDQPTGDVSVSGIPSERQVLTAANTLADEDGLGVVGYQWQRSGIDIEGETGPTYTLRAVDVGFIITVVASYIDGHGTSEQVTSPGVGPVVSNQVPTGSVTIAGTAREDETLTSSNSLADADGLGQISYQWQRDGIDIPDATSDSYTLRQIDVGTAITVVANYTDLLGTDEAVSSAATDTVANVNDSPGGGVTIDNSDSHGRRPAVGCKHVGRRRWVGGGQLPMATQRCRYSRSYQRQLPTD